MYTQGAVSALMGRLGWRFYPASFPFALNANNKQSDSGRYFQEFSSFVTLHNIHDAMEDENADRASFNRFLLEMQRATITSVLSALFRESHTSRKYRNFDFDVAVTENTGVFDEAIGLQMACMVVEMMSASTRSN